MLSVSATQPMAWYENVTTTSALPDVAFHTTPTLSPYRRDFLAATLNHINQVKEKNPSRMYLFNLFVQNNAMNGFAVELMSFIVEYAQYLYSRHTNKSLNEIIQESVLECCSYASSILIVTLPELAQLMPAEVYLDATRNVEAYFELARTLGNYFPGYTYRFKEFLGDQSMFQQSNPAAGYAMLHQPMANQQAQMNVLNIRGENYAKMPDGSLIPVQLGQNGVYYAVPPGTPIPGHHMGWQNMNQPMQGPYGYGQPAPSGVYTGGPRNFGQGNGFYPPAPGAQDDSFMPSSVRVQNQKPAQPVDYSARPAASSNPAVDESKNLPEPCLANWRPSEQQPYRRFYNPEFYREEFANGSHQNVVQRLVAVKAYDDYEGEEMDRNEHILPMVRVEYARKKHFVKTVQKANDIPVKLVIEQIDTDQKTEATKMIQDSWFSCVSITEAVSAAQIRHLEKQKEEPLDIYHTFNNIVHVLPGDPENKELIGRLSTAQKDNTTVRALLSEHYEKANAEAVKQILAEDRVVEIHAHKAFYHKVNNYLTQLANELLRYSLSTEVKIDSYVADYTELEAYLRKEYSDTHADALKQLDERLNTDFFSFTKAVDIAPVVDAYTLGEESVKPDYCSFSEVATVTSLSLTSEELFGEGLALTSNTNGIYVDPQYDRLLGLTVEYIFRNQRLLGFQTYRHYLVTSDGETFMVNKALLSGIGGVVHRIEMA